MSEGEIVDSFLCIVLCLQVFTLLIVLNKDVICSNECFCLGLMVESLLSLVVRYSFPDCRCFCLVHLCFFNLVLLFAILFLLYLDFEVAKDILIFTVVENYAFCRPCTQLAINKGFEMPMLLGCLVEGVRNLICQIRI